jgi:hypothetical protein
MKMMIKMSKTRISQIAKKKVNINVFLTLVAFVVIVSIAFPLVLKFHIKPTRWKQQFYIGIINQDPSFDKENVKKYCNCVYDSLTVVYKNVNNIPNSNEFTSEDKRAMLNCGIQFLVEDDSEKIFIRENIDEISKGLINLDTIQ